MTVKSTLAALVGLASVRTIEETVGGSTTLVTAATGEEMFPSLLSTMVFDGSATAAPMGAVTVVAVGGVTVTVRVAEAPALMEPPLKVTTPAAWEAVKPFVPLAVP